MTLYYRPRISTFLAPLLLFTVLGAITACSGSNESGGQTSVPTFATSDTSVAADTDTTTPVETTPGAAEPFTYPNGIRGVRYCEVLNISLVDQLFRAEVWTSMGFGECPQDQWEALDATAIGADSEAVVTLLNGPRYWTIDRIDSDIRDSAPVQQFGDITMLRAATIDLGNALPSQVPYTERTINRETVFVWEAGTEVHQLVSPDGSIYTMQSFSIAIKSDQTLDTLSLLGASLQLPDGWTYQSLVLTEDRQAISVDGRATVVQDEFQNTYQRIDTAP